MPVPKSVRKAAREGGFVRGRRGDVKQEATLEQKPIEEGDVAGNFGAGPQVGDSGTFVLQVMGAKLKENSRGVYRSVTARDASGKKYWVGLPTDTKIGKGDMLTVTGKLGKPFGEEPSLFFPIKNPTVDSIGEPAVGSGVNPDLKIQGADDDTLSDALAGLLKRFGMARILQGLSKVYTT